MYHYFLSQVLKALRERAWGGSAVTVGAGDGGRVEDITSTRPLFTLAKPSVGHVCRGDFPDVRLRTPDASVCLHRGPSSLCSILGGHVSAVLTPIFASTYSFFSVLQLIIISTWPPFSTLSARCAWDEAREADEKKPNP